MKNVIIPGLLKPSKNFSFGEGNLGFKRKSGLLTAFSKAFPQTRLVLGKALLLILIFGTYEIFAQETVELPEPVFIEDSAYAVRALPETAGFWLPDFDEIVYYLWNFDSVTPAAMDFLPVASLAAAASTDAPIPNSIRNNKYFVESVRLTNLAQQAFEEGDYDLSAQYSEQAVHYAQLSDEYVALQLKIRETDNAIAAANARLDWASSSAVNAAARFPNEYNRAQAAYADARNFRGAERWDDAIYAANQVIDALAYVTEAPPPAPPAPPPAVPVEVPLPAQYTVRSWAVSKDCLWNIAGRPWAYGDPTKWKILYNTNKARMPQPENPDLIHPGMILDIPSIQGETRSGLWDASKTYSPLKK
jgi:hypothetical protein